MYCNSSVLPEIYLLHADKRNRSSKTSSKEDKIPQVHHQNKQKMPIPSIYPKKSQDTPYYCSPCTEKGRKYTAK